MISCSIIIPFYNQKVEYLDKAIYSVINQSLHNIEIICIDDGSEDMDGYNAVSILSKQNKRIKLYRKEHQGAGIARNLGISLAVGENIMFLDSDDYYPNGDVLKVLYDIKKEKKVDIVGGISYEERNNRLNPQKYGNFELSNFFCNKIIKYKDYQFPFGYWCFMYDSKLIKNNKIYFPPFLRYQDVGFFVRVMNKAEYFYAADFVSYIHRESYYLFNMTEKMAKDYVNGIIDVLKYAKENNLEKLFLYLKETFFSYDIENILKKSELTLEEIENYINQVDNI